MVPSPTTSNELISGGGADCNTLIQGIIQLCDYVADSHSSSTTTSSSMIEAAQRLVIRSLSARGAQPTYAPSEGQDKKVWYLELLEQQTAFAEESVERLQKFIKKVSIEVQGSLSSAASIKAASMDLAQNTKQTADEIKALKEVISLIKNDLGPAG